MARQTQHRPEREAAQGKLLSHYRRENQQLKRQLARLQKRITQLEGTQAPEEVQGEAPREVTAQTCGCGGEIRGFTTPGGKVFKACKSCKARAL